MAEAMTPVDPNSPLAKAWDEYKGSDAFRNSKKWALTIAPMLQAGSPDFEMKRACEIMPFDQRERHVDGSLWSAFVAGYNAALTQS